MVRRLPSFSFALALVGAAFLACSSFDTTGDGSAPAPDGGGDAFVPPGDPDAGTPAACTGIAEERDAAQDANCNGDGLPVDLLSSDGNCGRCGRSCGGDGCSSGLCATPSIYSAGGSVLVLRSPDLFWAPYGFSATISRGSLDGGAATALTTTSSNSAVMALAVDDTRLYVNVQDEIYSLPRDSDGGAAKTPLSPNNNTRFGLALDDQYAYWSAGNVIERAKKDGSAAPAPISSPDANNASVANLAADPSGLYWTTVGATTDAGTAPNKLYAKTGTDVVVRAQGFGSPAGLALDATHAYWIDTDKGEVLRVARTGASAHEVVARWTTAKRYVRSFLLDATHVYWTVTESSNTYAAHVFRAPKCGGGDVEIVAEGEAASNLVDDGTSLYWQSVSDIRRVRK